MIVTINTVPQNIKLTSVILESDPEHPDIMQVFHCWKCGDIIGQFLGGTVSFILPGGEVGVLPWIVFCRKCKTRYLINSKL